MARLLPRESRGLAWDDDDDDDDGGGFGRVDGLTRSFTTKEKKKKRKRNDNKGIHAHHQTARPKTHEKEVGLACRGGEGARNMGLQWFNANDTKHTYLSFELAYIHIRIYIYSTQLDLDATRHTMTMQCLKRELA